MADGHVPSPVALPFFIVRSSDVFSGSGFRSTREVVHGLLRLERDALVVQWRTLTQTDHYGKETRTDTEVAAVQRVVVPLDTVAGARVRVSRWNPFGAPRLVLTASDLTAFEAIAGSAGLSLDHPAELVLRLRRADRLAAEEFAAELSLAVAERLNPGRAWPQVGANSP